MKPIAIDLRPNRDLLNPNFDGYKLSLAPIPVVRHALSAPPDRLTAGESQYSFLQVQLFGLQNHLVRDPWTPGTAYFVDRDLNVQKIHYKSECGQLESLKTVFCVPLSRERAEGDYNISIQFVSGELCLLANGQNQLSIIERSHANDWAILKKVEPFPDAVGGFLVVSALLASDRSKIYAVLQHVEQSADKTSAAFETVLTWLTFKNTSVGGDIAEWQVVATRELRGKSAPNFVAVEASGEAIVLASEHRFRVVSDSERAVIETVKVTAQIGSSYVWNQTDTEIVISFSPCGGEKSEYRLQCTGNRINIRHTPSETEIIDTELAGTIKIDETNWNLESGSLVLTLVKESEGNHWANLCVDGPPESLSAIEQTEIANKSTSLLDTQMEDCDFGENGLDTEYYIERINTEHNVTHQIYLGNSSPIIFNVILKAGSAPAIAIRHDVDTCIWSMVTEPDWTLAHEGTLSAFGYVQASKLQKKYVSCSPDLRYSVICEASRHVFVYCDTNSGACGLRRRNGPQISVGQQKLISLNETGAGGDQVILGISVENDICLLLTDQNIICVQLKTDEL